MKRLGFNGPFQCVMCKEKEESLDHLLLQCDIAQGVWKLLLRKLGWETPLPKKVIDLFKSWFTEYRKSTLSSLWTVSPSIAIWELWKERNRQVFQDKEEALERVCDRVERAISEVVSAATVNHNFLEHPYCLVDIFSQS
ncbi:uncharacterized protein LOC131873581, partial [Cryptomeria japonica]|uniref:uncharacterized protein LOC131873581 n=1 Tax=Cryptomeria japonica TaxID=3369 RepID=UPI0027D9D75D